MLSKIVYPLIGWLALILTVGITAKLALDLRLALASMQWSGHSALVSQISVVEVGADEDGPTYEPKIVYSYQVGGKSYVSDRFSYRQLQTGVYSQAAKELVGLNVGQEVEVFVNPANPKQSVVLRGTDAYNYLQPVLGLIFLFFVARSLINHYSG